MLTEEFRKSSSQFVMLAGLIKDEDMPIDLETLKAADCGLEVETLGDNHTRIALQYLHAAGQLENGVVKVRIYHGLTDDEALEVGFMHNNEGRTVQEDVIHGSVKANQGKSNKF